ncbi:MAG: ComF family protein [Deltaproteobacteria bacterium]|jgi:ComF family protein|nr:ComF family protein [Deltaproteobacteria bacterium]MBW2537325.1 ComF family protein [Deltaproteobacteria bacterium]
MRSPRGPVPVIAFAAYGGSVAQALCRLKYEDRPDLALPLGALARRAVRQAGLDADVVVPVPLHPRRLAERGYNQAALLARAVAAELQAPLRSLALQRVRPTLPQAALQRRQRESNVAAAFRVRQPRQILHRRVALVDDVITTGATVIACADAMRAAGARSVAAIAVARAT